MNFLLFIHNIGFIVSAIASLGLTVMLLVNNRRSTANVITALLFLMAAVFAVSHVAGVSTSDAELSKVFFMFNLCLFFMGVFAVHSVLASTDPKKHHRVILSLLYFIATIMTVFFIFNSSLFLLPSVPKMYFPNYYNPGELNFLRLIYLYGLCIPYLLYKLVLGYRSSKDERHKRHLKYIIMGFLAGFIPGFIPNFLVYNIHIDPLWGMLSVFFSTIPIVFGAIQNELFDVKVIAKSALVYGIAITTVGTIISIFNFANQLLLNAYPYFPFWLIPLITSSIIIGISIFIWNKLRESDLLKYEFITIATHKFRTPLTHIKWATDNLFQKKLDPDSRLQLEYIQGANNHLVELTDLLVTASEDEASTFEYQTSKVNMAKIFEAAIASFEAQILQKKIIIEKQLFPVIVECDENRIKSVIQALLENAIHYTPENGYVRITVIVDPTGKSLICSVADSGIGISKEEMPLIFSKFYRGAHARLIDTEGMGIGLFIAKEVITRHGGKMWIESPGKDQGTIFYFSMPLSKN